MQSFANIHDTKSGVNSAKAAFKNYHSFKSLSLYRKTFEEDVFRQLGLFVDISKRIKPKFEVLMLNVHLLGVIIHDV